MTHHDAQQPEPISAQMDSLALALIEYSLDLLADLGDLSVTLAVEDAHNNHVVLSFDDEDFEESLEEAHETLRRAVAGTSPLKELEGVPVRYALAYDGAVDEDGSSGYVPALIVEYGEKGMSSGYSAYLCYENAGKPRDFVCSDPAPAGLVELLV